MGYAQCRPPEGTDDVVVLRTRLPRFSTGFLAYAVCLLVLTQGMNQETQQQNAAKTGGRRKSLRQLPFSSELTVQNST